MKSYLQSLSNRSLAVIALILCFPAFLLNLGKMAFIGDEGIRTLVAFEMKLSGDFIVPTLSGEQYFNKPPLYNWFIYLFSEGFGTYGEWPTRMTTLVFLTLFAVTIFYFSKKYFDRLTAFTMAMLLLTSGRILFWDSMLGLIDICFSWIIYVNFMILYSMAKSERWRAMFIFSYLLFSVAFLLKGLPAVVFQGISVITALVLHGQWKRRFFSWDHWIGAAIGVLPVIAYYAVFAANVDLRHVFEVLLDQSMQRTGTRHGIAKTLLHVLTFPPEQVYHFLPWSLLLGILFHPRWRAWMNANEFIRFNFWMLLANVPVYWLSVQVYPRYLLMFIPLFNMVGYFLLQESRRDNGRWWKGMHGVLASMTILATLASLVLPWIPGAGQVPGIWWIWPVSAVLMGFCLAGMMFDQNRMFIWMVIGLLGARIVFDLVVLPSRASTARSNVIRDDCQRVADIYKDNTWYLYKETYPHQVARCYLSVYTDQIIGYSDHVEDPQAIYLVDRKLYADFPGILVDSVKIEMNGSLALMQAASPAKQE